MRATVKVTGADIASAKEKALRVLRSGGVEIYPSRIEWTDAEPHVFFTYADQTHDRVQWEVTGEYDFGDD